MPALTCVNVVEDIEDLFTTSENEGTNSRLASRKYIFPKVRKPQLNAVPTVHRPLAADSIIPGLKLFSVFSQFNLTADM